MLSRLCKVSADEIFIYFFFFPKKIGFDMLCKLSENRLWNFIQIVSLEDNLPEMSKPIFWEK